MSKEPVVYQANPLIEGRREFDLMETRLFYIGLRELAPRLTTKDVSWGSSVMDDFPTVTIPTTELIKLFGNDKYYSTLEDICDGMAKKTVKIKRVDSEKFDIYTVFSRLSYDSSGGLTLRFNPDMIPWLLDLANKPFTKLPFEQIWKLSARKKEPYAIRLLELILQYQNTKTHERTISIEELKQYLGMPLDSYEGRTNIFRKRIVDNNIKSINKSTSYKIEYENVKEGRKIVAFKFKLHLPAEIKKAKRDEQIKNIGNIVQNVADEKEYSPDSTQEKRSPEQVKAFRQNYLEHVGGNENA